MIPLSVPNFIGNELKYVTEAIETEWVSTGGAYVTKFEKMTAGYVHSKGAVSCQNGTAGLHIALMVCGVERDQEVIVPTLTFIAAVNPVRYIGAEPVFMDCDDSLCIDPEKLKCFCETECEIESGILIHKQTDKEIHCLVVVHVFGNMADMDRIMEIAEQFNLIVIEDATEAFGTYYKGGRYKGKFAGTIGAMGVYSFNGNKIITTGGGGMIVSDDSLLLEHAKHLITQAKCDELNYVHDEVGYNYRMTNLQAALGVAQLENLEYFIEIKERNYKNYKEKIEGKLDGMSLLSIRCNIRGNYWFYGLVIKDISEKNRDELIQFLLEHGIQVRPIWGLIHEQKPYCNCCAYRVEKAKEYRRCIINIPCSTKLTDSEIDKSVEILSEGKRILKTGMN